MAHKVVWEVLKRRQKRADAAGRPVNSGPLSMVKSVKIAILLGIAAQTLMTEILPIAEDPAMLRFVGVVLYTTGLAVAIVSRIQLGANWSDIEAAQVLRNQAVVAKGIYRFIRHPIYVADLFLLLGLELSLNSWLVTGVLLMAPVVLWKAVREERMLVEALPGYGDYCARTKRFIPFVV